MKKIVIGVVIVLGIFSSCVTFKHAFAPKFSAEGVHANAEEMTEFQCLECHREGKDKTPIAPKSMLERENCIRCHLK
jgi:hypothetical protein